MGKSNIPKDWRNNTNKGVRVPGTPCAPMKTPISTAHWDLETLFKSSPKVRSGPWRNSILYLLSIVGWPYY